MHRLKYVLSALREATVSPYFGFIQGHSHLDTEGLSRLADLVDADSPEVVAEFEAAFAALVGSGEAVAYAAARMGFFGLMNVLGIGRGDEVILPGATCAVMASAVLRAGATPVFADIDPRTLGSSAQPIAACMSPRTRLIVAQHSFGIPCDIEPIVALARSHDIFLLEDCALSLGSKIDGVAVGNFGDAALFSTDHSKPLNTITGGFVYTGTPTLAAMLRKSRDATPELPLARRRAIWKRLLLEREYCVPERYGRLQLMDVVGAMRRKLIGGDDPFLSEDHRVARSSSYPYPAKLPTFLAALGVGEAKRWPAVAAERKHLLLRLRGLLDKDARLPSAYNDARLEIVPLRLAWSSAKDEQAMARMEHFINVSWTWFREPIVATDEPLDTLGYRFGTCPISERLGRFMANIPCNVRERDFDSLLARLEKAFS